VVPVRRTEQVLCDLIRCAERRLAVTCFGIFQVPRLVVEDLERSLERGVALRHRVGDREAHSDQEIDRQRHQLAGSSRASIPRVLTEARYIGMQFVV